MRGGSRCRADLGARRRTARRGPRTAGRGAMRRSGRSSRSTCTLDLTGDVPGVDQLAGRSPIRVDAGDSTPADAAARAPMVRARRRQRALDRPGSRPGDRTDRTHVWALGRRSIVRSARFVPTLVAGPVQRRPAPPVPIAPDRRAGAGGHRRGDHRSDDLGPPPADVPGARRDRHGASPASTWASGWLAASSPVSRPSARRRRARGHSSICDLRAQCDAFVRPRSPVVPTLGRARAVIDRTDGPWQRRPSHGDAWLVSLGLGAVAWRPLISRPRRRARLGRSAPTHRVRPSDCSRSAVELEPGSATRHQRAARSVGLTTALVVQLAALTGPADWQLVVVTTSPDRWRWTGDLPHARDRVGRHTGGRRAGPAALAARRALTDRHTVVVTDQPALLAVRTSALRRLGGWAPVARAGRRRTTTRPRRSAPRRSSR